MLRTVLAAYLAVAHHAQRSQSHAIETASSNAGFIQSGAGAMLGIMATPATSSPAWVPLKIQAATSRHSVFVQS
jgi:uncharacterized membrane protein YfcA